MLLFVSYTNNCLLATFKYNEISKAHVMLITQHITPQENVI